MRFFKYLLAAALLAASTLAQAADKPTVKVISSLPVGSGPDVLVRRLLERLETQWNVSIVVENRPGGNGAVALGSYQADTANTTLYFGDSSNFVTLPILFKNTALLENIEPLAPVNVSELMLFSSPAIQNFNDLVSVVKKPHSYGSGGVASPFHFAALTFLDTVSHNNLGVHVPYKDYGQWFADTSNQVIQFGFGTVGSTGNLEKAGRLKYHAFTGAKRHPQWPQVPTVRELAGRNVEYIRPWVAFYIKKTVPGEIKQRYSADIVKILSSAEFVQIMRTLNYEPWEVSVAEFQRFVAVQSQLYQSMIVKHNITAN